jgi:hypothetical protein
MDVFTWLQDWYIQNCDGDWEHCYGIKIETLDNPGWCIDIDLTGTNLEDEQFQTTSLQRSDNNWFYCEVADNIYKGHGGIANLKEIIEIFYQWVTEKN